MRSERASAPSAIGPIHDIVVLGLVSAGSMGYVALVGPSPWLVVPTLLATLFVPGYFLSIVLWPAPEALSGFVRMALSIGLSVSIVAVNGVIVQGYGAGFTAPAVRASVLGILLLTGVGAAVRRRQTQACSPRPLGGPMLLVVVLGLLTLAGGGYMAKFLAMHPSAPATTELYFVPVAAGRVVANPPAASPTVTIGVTNQEHEAMRYDLVVSLNGASVSSRSLELDDNQTVHETISLPGQHGTLRVDLRRAGQSQAYRTLRLALPEQSP